MGGKKVIYLIVSILLISLFIQSAFSSLVKSPNWDEGCYLGAGKSLVDTGNLKATALMYQPPLSYYLSSVFLLFLDVRNKPFFYEPDCWKYTPNLIFHSGYDPLVVIFLARLPIILLSLILGIFVFKWASELYGTKAGLLALFIYSFSPSIIAYSQFALSDFVATAFIFISAYYFWRFLQQQTVLNLILAGFIFGLAQLSKITALYLIPLYFIVVLIKVFLNKEKPKVFLYLSSLLFIYAIGFFIVFIGYGFEIGTIKEAMPEHYANRAVEEINKLPFKNLALNVFENFNFPFPSYLAGIGGVSYHSQTGVGSFLFGKIYEKTPWQLPIVTFLIKTPIPLLLLFCLALIIFFKESFVNKSRENFNEYYILLLILGLFIPFLFNAVTSGIRHILQVYPFIFIFSSSIITLKPRSRSLFNMSILILVLWLATTSLITYPDYLPYFNEFAGDNGYMLLSGSAVDFGQDLYQLKLYMNEHDSSKIKLSYWGSIDPAEYGIDYEYLPSPYYQPWVPGYVKYSKNPLQEDCTPKRGLIAISITNLQNVFLTNKTCYDWLNQYPPIEKIGGTIFIYDI